jgi:hypothetical protein
MTVPGSEALLVEMVFDSDLAVVEREVGEEIVEVLVLP